MSFKDRASQNSVETERPSAVARNVAHNVVGDIFKHVQDQQQAPRLSGAGSPSRSPSTSSSNPNSLQASPVPLTSDTQSAPHRLSGSGVGGVVATSKPRLSGSLNRSTGAEDPLKPKVLSFAHDLGEEDETHEIPRGSQSSNNSVGIPQEALSLAGRSPGGRKTAEYQYDPARKSEMWDNHIPTNEDGDPIRNTTGSSAGGSFQGAIGKFFRKVSGNLYEDEIRRSNGAVYNGTVKNKLATGEGTQKWPNGAQYGGQWEDDHMHGFGKLTTPDGAVYEGQFHFNKQQGEGTYVDAHGGRYEGSWSQGKMQGKGKFQWADGPFYEGEFEQGERTGYGVLAYTNGARHEGNWLNGRQHGKGVFIDPNRIRREGIWEHGERVKWLDGHDQYSLPKGALTFEISDSEPRSELIVSAAQRPSSFGPPHADRCSDRCTQNCAVM